MADNPNYPDGPKKYYEFWDQWTNSDNDGDHKEPEFELVGSGSDHFLQIFLWHIIILLMIPKNIQELVYIQCITQDMRPST